MGAVGIAVRAGIGLVAALVALAAIAYATDAPVQATVVAKQCGQGGGLIGNPAGPGTVTVRAELFGIRHTMEDVPPTQCNAIQVQNFVQYRIRSHRTSLWDHEGGTCIWDTVRGIGGCP